MGRRRHGRSNASSILLWSAGPRWAGPLGPQTPERRRLCSQCRRVPSPWPIARVTPAPCRAVDCPPCVRDPPPSSATPAWSSRPVAPVAGPPPPTSRRQGRRLPQLRRDGRRARQGGRRLTRTIVQKFSIGKSYQGREHLGGQDLATTSRPTRTSPRSCSTALHHAREHLTRRAGARRSFAGWPTATATDAPDHPHRRHARDLHRLHGQPGRRRVRPDRFPVPRLAQEPPAERRARRTSARTSIATTTTTGRAAAARRARRRRDTYRGPKAFSAPETRAMRDFIDSRVVDGRQQIKTAITFHTAGEQVLWPYGYTYADIPLGHDRATTTPRSWRSAKKMAAHQRLPRDAVERPVHHRRRRDRLGVRHATGSSCTRSRCIRATRGELDRRFYPPDEVIGRETTAQQGGGPVPDRRAGCRYDVIGKAQTNCGPLFDDFEIAAGWKVDPHGTDTATRGAWQRADPSSTNEAARDGDLGSKVIVTGAGAGSTSSANDVDGGRTSIRRRRRAARGAVGQVDVPLLPRARLDSVVGRLVPGLRRGG